MAYFRLAQRVSVLGKLDGWLRRRLRQIRWKEWKTTAAKRHNLRIRGISESEARKWAGVSRRYWKAAGSQILQVSLRRLGLLAWDDTVACPWLRSASVRIPHDPSQKRLRSGILPRRGRASSTQTQITAPQMPENRHSQEQSPGVTPENAELLAGYAGHLECSPLTGRRPR